MVEPGVINHSGHCSGARRRELAAACDLDPHDVVWVSAQTGDGIGDLRALVAEVLDVS